MMQISASDVAKFKAALAKYQNAQKEERIRIETMKREEQARIEHERQEKQRQDRGGCGYGQRRTGHEGSGKQPL